MFEKFNGSLRYLVKLLKTQRNRYQVDGPLTQLACDVVGFGDTEELATKAEKRSKYA